MPEPVVFRILLSTEDFRNLVTGKIINRTLDDSHQIQMGLSDIGFGAMTLILSKAMLDAAKPDR